MLIGYDPAKNNKNVRERGFSFPEAATIFYGPVMEWEDTRFVYPERRMVATGMTPDGAFFTVVYTMRENVWKEPVRWIISARVANRKERRAYGHRFAH